MKKLTTLLAAFVLGITSMIAAQTIYCSPTGTRNGDGSLASPYDFVTALSKMQSGDTLYCRGGQYDYAKSITINCPSGTASRRTAIFAYPGEKPVFDFRGVSYGTRGFSLSNNYIHMKGLTIRYSGKNGLLNNGSYCVFELLDVYGHGDSGVQMKNGHSNLILNCDSHDNFDYKLSGITAADFGGNADGFADKQYSGGGNTYRGCRAWNNSDDGWDFYQHKTEGYGPTIIENCVCYNNGPGTYDMRGHARYETDKSWFDQFQGEGIDVADNDGNYPCRVSLEKYTNWGNANGFKLGGGQTNHDVILRNSISVANGLTCTQGVSKGAKGIDQNNNAGVMYIFNNTAYHNARNIGFDQSACGTAYIYNNVSYKSVASDNIVCQTHYEKQNSWDIQGLVLTDETFMSLNEALLLAERNADGSLALGNLLRPMEDSKLIDAGTSDTGLSYYNNAPDLGYYELPSGECHEGTGKVITPEGSDDPDDDPELDPTKFTIGFVSNGTKGTNSQDAPIIEAIKSKYNILYFDAGNASNSYDKCDAIVISSLPSSGAAAMKALKGYDLPILLLKTFTLKSSVWNWGTAVNYSDLSITVTNPSHALFNGIDIDANSQIKLFTQKSGDGAVTGISSWTSCSGFTTLATPVSATTSTTIADIPAGARMNGTTLSKPMVMIGVSEYSTAYLTDDAKRLIVNACEYILGHNLSTGISTVINDSDIPATAYNLAGQKTDKNYKGIIILKGKKFYNYENRH